ncbi:DUF3397 domain-containing protein [Salibacterium halotolerans]|uniref:DUF3397 domain-containing protein n=1 Tax=Salibacterium halotolerans TaxID=1884432 RepID=A0A1I5M3V4_9BACI|nr:DUF3397 domain-containing protein [Salibacterium halotolerans]SFP04242.1 Protein of unknown function [Salibacterium halotolerans]
MIDFLAAIGTMLLTFPPAVWYLVYISVVKTTKNKGKALRRASDSTAVLFIAAAALLLHQITGDSYVWLLIVIILLTAVVFTIIHYRTMHDIECKRLLKGIWRFTFFLYFCVYLLLCFYLLGTSLLSTFLG